MINSSILFSRIEANPFGVIPVSYTHLDVYKRQGELPGVSVQDGVIEVVVSASEYNANFFKLGTVYPMSQGRQPEEGGEYLQFKVVGVYAVSYTHHRAEPCTQYASVFQG